MDELENPVLVNIYTKLFQLYDHIDQLNTYSQALAQGNLEIDFPPRNNKLVGGLKDLHANLLHLTWKVEQISKGRYNLTLDFMGKFSAAFNHMVRQLELRNIQLAESQNVVEALSMYSNLLIFVLNSTTGELIYCKDNQDPQTANRCELNGLSQSIAAGLNQHMHLVDDHNTAEWELYSEIDQRWYSVKSLRMYWTNNEKVYFHMLFDISDDKRKREKLEQAVVKDAMTGVFNHSYAYDTVDRLLKDQEGFAIIFFDLDGLKKINDELGHLVGDRLIECFVATVVGSIRSKDIFCRMGGDEFLLILPTDDKTIVDKIIHRITSTVQGINESRSEPFEVSFSYGIEYPQNYHEDTADSLIDKADKKMYTQKRLKGRGDRA